MLCRFIDDVGRGPVASTLPARNSESQDDFRKDRVSADDFFERLAVLHPGAGQNVPTVSFQPLHLWFVIDHGHRRLIHVNVTLNLIQVRYGSNYLYLSTISHPRIRS